MMHVDGAMQMIIFRLLLASKLLVFELLKPALLVILPLTTLRIPHIHPGIGNWIP